MCVLLWLSQARCPRAVVRYERLKKVEGGSRDMPGVPGDITHTPQTRSPQAFAASAAKAKCKGKVTKGTETSECLKPAVPSDSTPPVVPGLALDTIPEAASSS